MRKETVSYSRPPPIPQPRVLDDEPEARVRHTGEPEEPCDHGRRPTPDRVAARDLRSEPEQLFVGPQDPLLVVVPGEPRAREDPHGFCVVIYYARIVRIVAEVMHSLDRIICQIFESQNWTARALKTKRMRCEVQTGDQ